LPIAKRAKGEEDETDLSFRLPILYRRQRQVTSKGKSHEAGGFSAASHNSTNSQSCISKLRPLLLPPVERSEPTRAEGMIELLEHKRKSLRSDGLYNWVLWKQALTDSLLRYTKQIDYCT